MKAPPSRKWIERAEWWSNALLWPFVFFLAAGFVSIILGIGCAIEDKGPGGLFILLGLASMGAGFYMMPLASWLLWWSRTNGSARDHWESHYQNVPW